MTRWTNHTRIPHWFEVIYFIRPAKWAPLQFIGHFLNPSNKLGDSPTHTPRQKNTNAIIQYVRSVINSPIHSPSCWLWLFQNLHKSGSPCHRHRYVPLWCQSILTHVLYFVGSGLKNWQRSLAGGIMVPHHPLQNTCSMILLLHPNSHNTNIQSQCHTVLKNHPNARNAHS